MRRSLSYSEIGNEQYRVRTVKLKPNNVIVKVSSLIQLICRLERPIGEWRYILNVWRMAVTQQC
jgi:hypothetical protein